MATSQMSGVIQHLRRAVLLRDGAGLTDEQLLSDYLNRRDEAAFAALVRRHGPMVWGVCRRVLHNYDDAEDAFQASFLVLVRKAAAIASRELLANWLYGVAQQTALKARAMLARRKGRERQVTEMPEPVATEQDFWHDLQPLLDEELGRLPDKYRSVIVLCDLEGKTRREAARQLAVPEGSVAGWLARARVMLAKRLARRGVALSGGALAALLAQNVASAGVPHTVMSSTIQAASVYAAGQAAAAGVVSVTAAALTEGVLKSMLLTKLKVATAVLVGVFACVAGGTVAFLPRAAGQQEAQPTGPKATADDKKSDKDKLQGEWVAVSGEFQGAPLDGEDPRIKFWKLTFDGDNVTLITKDGDAGRQVAYTLDPEKKPKEMDVTIGGGTLLTVYEFEGGKLKWAWVKGGDRPSDFDTGKSNGILLIFEKKKE